MNAMLDGNTAALNEYEIHQAAADRAWNACVGEATARVRDAYKPDFELLLDQLAALSAADQQELLDAIANDALAVGAIVQKAHERCVDAYLASDKGQQAIADMVWLIHEEERG